MKRKHLVLTILSMVLMMSLLVGCNSTTADMTPTQAEPTPTQAEPTPTLVEPSPTPIVPTLTPEDPSIVWSDDFEDGDAEGWEAISGNPIDDENVVEGVLSVVYNDIFIHPSTVTTGTWSFDIFIPEENERATNEIYFIVSEIGAQQFEGFPITIEHQPFTVLEFNHLVGSDESVMETVAIGEGERLTGWHHFDITRDDDGNVKVYFNKEFVYEFNEDFPHESENFTLWFCCRGPALDNMVVRNQVIDIQPTE